MQTRILYLFTRTPLHVGAGSSVGAVDQPVIRERHTGFPVIPGSGIKGVLADDYIERDEKGKPVQDSERNATKRTEDGAAIFGLGASKQPDDQGRAGAVSFGEAKLLAFPVRSAKGCFAWITSPFLIERWKRDSKAELELPGIPKGLELHGNGETLADNGKVVLEDYALDFKGEWSPGDAFAELASDSLWRNLAATHLCLVSDDMMGHFARNACEVAQHVVIDDESGTAKEGLLFNQENVPAETMFYSVLRASDNGVLEKLRVPEVLQLGGDATTGLGFCGTNLVAVS